MTNRFFLGCCVMSVIQETDDAPGEIAYGPFVIAPAACTIAGGGRVVHLDPQAIDVLVTLASAPGQEFSKDDLARKTGANAEKTLAKLQGCFDLLAPGALQATDIGWRLDHDPRPAEHAAETPKVAKPWIPERWKPRPLHLAVASALAVAGALPVAAALHDPVRQDKPRQAAAFVDTADEDYFQYSFAKNEQAITLYQRAIRRDPMNARAYAGLANALVQRVVRWPQGDGSGAKSFSKLDDALKAGLVDQPKSQQVLRRALRMAQKAIQLNPRDAAAHKALALVHSAQRDFGDAVNGYKRAVALDPDAWGPMINIGDILEIQGRSAEAVPYFEQAYATMARVYGPQTVRVRPWHSELGIHIGDSYRARGELKQSVQWYRKVLDNAPLHPEATGRLAAVLHQSGDERTARELCAALKSRLGAAADCSS